MKPRAAATRRSYRSRCRWCCSLSMWNTKSNKTGVRPPQTTSSALFDFTHGLIFCSRLDRNARRRCKFFIAAS